MKPSQACCILAIVLITICSCKNSPATMVMGNYEGVYYRDTINVGAANIGVIEVNPLTVNLTVDLANDPDFNLNNVEVDSDTSWYNLLYSGIEGSMTGTIMGNHMNWTLMSATDTITFHGDKVQ